MSPVHVALKILPHAADLPRPGYATASSAGVDLAAAVASEIALAPGERRALALTHGITILNSPGTIDADYRGEIQVILANLGSETVTLARGQRIAQLVVAPVSRVAFDEVGELPASGRGAGGFGSTG